MAERKATIAAEVGLHARPAATFVQTAAKAAIDVTVGKANGPQVNAKSILSVMALDVRQGETIVIVADGEGAEELLDELVKIAEAP
ncbi:HPr family phosphocarrier protein [Nonomuraea typhae]|uniref:HPr family phosphocarrier protein n=1 Tax=Nonomuraea typhae TaxID=2603600 RepID=UPI0012F7095D|nr:HPr family phosphocarrier protein [Nonomuraea typhae]